MYYGIWIKQRKKKILTKTNLSHISSRRHHWSIMAWKMCPFHRGKQLKSVVAHRLEQVRHKRWHLVCYGYPIMLYRDAPAVRQNSGWVDESITVGKYGKYIDKISSAKLNVRMFFFFFCFFFLCSFFFVCGIFGVVGYRSCGQIFCADCSEFWAALPDERLFDPVRLCGPCYHNVTTKIQVSNSMQQNGIRNHVKSAGRII